MISGQTPFEFQEGVCASFGTNGETAVLCSPKIDGQKCWSFDGENFEDFGETKVHHHLGAMATFRDGVAIVAGQRNSATKGKECETFESECAQFSLYSSV